MNSDFPDRTVRRPVVFKNGAFKLGGQRLPVLRDVTVGDLVVDVSDLLNEMWQSRGSK